MRSIGPHISMPSPFRYQRQEVALMTEAEQGCVQPAAGPILPRARTI